MANIDQFVKDTEGRLIGTNSANYGECVGLVQDWFQVEDEPFFYGDAKDLYNNAPDPNYAKGTSWPAPAGAAAVFNSSWGGGAGHVMLSVDGKGQVLEQNNPLNSPTKLSNYGGRPNGYIGWILPRSYQQTNQQGDEIMTPDEEKLAYNIVLGRQPEAGAGLGHRTALQFIRDAEGELSDDRKQARDDAAKVSDYTAQLAQKQESINNLQDIVNQRDKQIGVLQKQKPSVKTVKTVDLSKVSLKELLKALVGKVKP